MSNKSRVPRNARGWAGCRFFCPLCGMRLHEGAHAYWCQEHGAFDIQIEDDRPFVKKIDAA